MAAKRYTAKCAVRKPLSARGLIVLAGAAVGTMLMPTNAPVGAVAGGFIALVVLKAY